jgi:type I restriction enzyme S subunit
VGSTRKSINTKILEGLEVLLPPLPEQRRIAEILGSVDESIRATKAVIEQTKKVKKGLLQQLLTRGIGHTRFKQTEIGEIPESWEVVRLDELATAPICYGIVQPGPSVASGVPMVAIRDMGRPLGIALHRASPDIEGKYVRSRVRQGDVLLSVKGTTGRVHEVADGFSGNISRDIARLRLSTPGITSFMAAFLQSVPGQKALEDITVGSTRAELSIKRLRRLLVPLAPDGERLRIGQMAKYYEKLELRQEKALLMLANCKTGLMQDLLTGKVRVKV